MSNSAHSSLIRDFEKPYVFSKSRQRAEMSRGGLGIACRERFKGNLLRRACASRPSCRENGNKRFELTGTCQSNPLTASRTAPRTILFIITFRHGTVVGVVETVPRENSLRPLTSDASIPVLPVVERVHLLSGK
ncbi:hypothetical protein J6590_038879 [Homalodisca vitripennis]|nr:hypothetical protein J6590_038879 [Homalodisca vitripennis]